jgi:hypothetical protein
LIQIQLGARKHGGIFVDGERDIGCWLIECQLNAASALYAPAA